MLIYKNGKEILPAELLTELQKYVQGELIYVPKRETTRAGWGQLNGTRQTLHLRNLEIMELYRIGCSVQELTERFHLSEDSLKKIINRYKKGYAV